MRREVDRQHRQVRSRPGDAVPYNAFDTGLQLWVAACLYAGFSTWLFSIAHNVGTDNKNSGTDH